MADTMLSPVDVIFNSEDTQTLQTVSGTTDNPTFTLLPSVEDCVGISLIYANVPFTYNVFDATNNTFKIIDAAHSGGVTITIAPGTYNSVSLATQLQTQIAASALTHASSFVCFVDSTTSKLRIYDNNASSATFTLDFTSSTDGFQSLGFRATTYVAATTTFKDDSDADVNGKYSVVGPRVVNLTGPAQMFLNSDLGSSVYGKCRNQTDQKGLLGFWPVNSNYQGTIEYAREDPPMYHMSKTNISKVTLSLGLGSRSSYHDGTSAVSYLPLQGESFQVGLRFWTQGPQSQRGSDGVASGATVGNSSFDPRMISARSVSTPMSSRYQPQSGSGGTAGRGPQKRARLSVVN